MDSEIAAGVEIPVIKPAGRTEMQLATTAHQKAEAAYAQALRLLKELSPEDSEPLNVRLAMFRTALDRLATKTMAWISNQS